MDRYSNEYLEQESKGVSGLARAAGYLLKLDEADREAADREGRIYANKNPGWRYASAVGMVVDRFLKGDKSTPLTTWNSQQIEKEQRMRERQYRKM